MPHRDAPSDEDVNRISRLRAFASRTGRARDRFEFITKQIAGLVTSITVRHSALPYVGSFKPIGLDVEAKMEKVSSVLAYVVNEGRVCALKPSEWSILLVGVALCGFGTLVFLTARL